MQKTILTALALVGSAAVAMAGDLPSRKTAPLPPTDRPVADTQYYVGGNVGGDIGGQGAFSGGAVAGWTPFRFLSVEGAYDFQYPNSNYPGTGKTDYKNQLTISALPQYTFNSVPFTAYALAGVGYSWNAVTRSNAIYQVGGGVKYNVTRNWDVDTRYRYVNSFNEGINSAKPENRLTIGLNYKF